MEGRHEYKKGLWTLEEDNVLMGYVKEHGTGKWNRIAKATGLKRCGKSCRLRWMNYLSPNVKRGDFSKEEEDLIIRLHKLLGNRWSLIAGRIPGRTDNQVKNYWNTHLSKKLGVNKEKNKVHAPPKLVPNNNINEPTDSYNNTTKGTTHLEYNDEGENVVVHAHGSRGDQNFITSTEEVMITGDDFGSSLWFGYSELNVCTSFLTDSLQEYLFDDL